MTTPHPRRFQQRRTKGWRKPTGAISVSRPSVYGNPFTVQAALDLGRARTEEEARLVCVQAFADWVLRTGIYDWSIDDSEGRRRRLLDALPGLADRKVMCFCPLDQPCHADVLAHLADQIAWSPR